MILADTGPLVALFDPRDGAHARCKEALRRLRQDLTTTVPVLTEAFHMLTPASRGAAALRELVARGGLTVWPLDAAALERAFSLMDKYADHPMDLADASLIAAAEALRVTTVFTLDRNDFASYRIRRGHRYVGVKVVP